jgi:hypothetical protein
VFGTSSALSVDQNLKDPTSYENINRMVSVLGISSVPLPLSPNFFSLLYFVGWEDNIRIDIKEKR